MNTNDDNVRDYLERMKNAPRLTSLYTKFANIASGKSGRPHTSVILDQELLQHDHLAFAFAKIRQACAGVFNAHYVASLPYVLEEQCRFGAGMLLYAVSRMQKTACPLKVYTLGDASGVMARALTEISQGNIQTLTCSPNQENQKAFHDAEPGPNAHFFLGPFFEFTTETPQEKNLASFLDGFDIIIEDTTFQMYGPERIEPIALASRNLKDEGIFVVLEKIRSEDSEEYRRREDQKDDQFKRRYFDAAQISEKRVEILNAMRSQEATLGELSSALNQHFEAAVILWNSGNFYTIAASNSVSNLACFAEGMLPPAIPEKFGYEDLPTALFGDFKRSIDFRSPKNESDASALLGELQQSIADS